MKLEILQVPDCPNVAVLEQRIRQATGGPPVHLEVTHRVIDDPGQAAAAGMTGSPTLLVDGHDPFATPGQIPSLSCRLYPSDTGRLDGAPSVAALRTALRLDLNIPSGRAGDSGSSCCTPAAVDGSAEAALCAWRGAAQPADPVERAVHQSILRAFARAGGRRPSSS